MRVNILKKLFVYLFGKSRGNEKKSSTKSVEKKESAKSIISKEEKKYPYKNLDRDYIKEEKTGEEQRRLVRRKLWDLEERINRERLPNDNPLENEVIKALWNIKSKESKVLWNIYPRSKSGALGQVDIIYITAYKIYVIECKDYKNCIKIKGNENEKIGTFIYKSGHAYKTLNPIVQNKGHIWLLKSYLDIPEEFFESIVLIITADEVESVIESEKIIYLKNNERDEVRNRLEERVSRRERNLTDESILAIGDKLLRVMNPSKDVVNEHMEYVRNKKRNIVS